MQDRTSARSRKPLATHGRTIHSGHERLFGPLKTTSALPFRADLDGSSANRPLRADSVAKVPDGWLASNNRIERSTVPNQHCLEAPDLESMLRARAPKIVLQHYLPTAEVRALFDNLVGEQ
jgi:hypothetical protein